MAREQRLGKRRWICASDFEERPLNKSGLPRVELVRRKDDKVQFLAVKVEGKNQFISADDCAKKFSGDVLEVKIIDVR